MLVLADQSVAFPVSQNLSALYFCRALTNMALARHDAYAVWAAIPFTKRLTHALVKRNNVPPIFLLRRIGR